MSQRTCSGLLQPITTNKRGFVISKSFFTQRVVNNWNRLSFYTVQAPSVNAFMNKLDDFLRDMDD